MDIAGCSVAGPRPHNEDNFYYRDFAGLATLSEGVSAFALVCDGMGGHSAGDVASRVACETARAYIDSLLKMAQGHEIKLEIEAALQEIVAQANQAVIDEMTRTGSSSMGTTFVGAFLSPSTAWIAHVGDSRAYRIRDGVAEQLTRDHSVVGRMLADGLLTETQAQEHPERNVIERALGFNGDEAEINVVDLQRGDGLIFCSDGVSTVLSTDALCFAASQARSPVDAAKAVVEAALAAQTDDNATVVFATQRWRVFKDRVPKAKAFQRLRMNSPLKKSKGLQGQRLVLAIIGGLMVAIIGGILVASRGPSVANTGPAPVVSAGQSKDATQTAAKQTTGSTQNQTAAVVAETQWTVENTVNLRYSDDPAPKNMPEIFEDFQLQAGNKVYATEITIDGLQFLKLDRARLSAGNFGEPEKTFNDAMMKHPNAKLFVRMQSGETIYMKKSN